MKKYLLVFRIRLINNIQYRTVTFGAIASNIAWVLLELMIYVALYNSAGHVLPMTFSQMVSYGWIKRIVMNMLAVVAYDGEIYRTGKAYGLIWKVVFSGNSQ